MWENGVRDHGCVGEWGKGTWMCGRMGYGNLDVWGNGVKGNMDVGEWGREQCD